MKKNNTEIPKILILGANSGIGFAFVKHYIKTRKVIAVSRSTNNLEKLPKNNLDIIKADLTKELPEIDSGINKMINCIGIASFKPFEEITKEELIKITEINTIVPILTTQKYIRNLINTNFPEKEIIQIGSLAGLEPGHKNFSLYSATKMSLLGLYNSLSAEYETEDLRFILVAPHAYKSNISKDSIGGKDLQDLLDKVTLISADEMVQKILLEANQQQGNLIPLVIED